MSPTRSDAKMLGAMFALALALACSGTVSDQGAETTSAENALQFENAEAVRLMVPSGSVLSIELQQSLSSAESKAGDSFQAKLSEPVYVGDQLAIGTGATISGKVIDAWSAARGTAQLNLEFTGLELTSGGRVTIEASFHVEGQPEGAVPIGAPVIGRIQSEAAANEIPAGGAHTVIGAIVGSQNGTAVAASGDGQEVRIPTGTMLKIRLGGPVVLSAEA